MTRDNFLPVGALHSLRLSVAPPDYLDARTDLGGDLWLVQDGQAVVVNREDTPQLIAFLQEFHNPLRFCQACGCHHRKGENTLCPTNQL
jgi:hypothetical protein